MHKEPASRYRGAQEVKADLEAYLAGRPLAAFRYTAWQRAAKWVRRNRAVSGVSAAAALLLAVFVGWLIVALAESRANLELVKEERRRTAGALEDILELSEAAPVSALLRDDAYYAAWNGYPDRVGGLEAWLSRARHFEGRRSRQEDRIRGIEAAGQHRESDEWEVSNRRKLMDDLARLERSMAEAEDAIARADRLQTLSQTLEHREAWERAEDEGLALPPTAALLPIGRDPESGLWELWLVESGVRPERGPDGRIQLEAGSGVVLVLLREARFLMGSDPAMVADETPVHEVILRSFLISKYELTRGQWSRACGPPPGDPRDALLPVEQLRWEDCRRTLARWGLRLPSEAEWEFAARAGTTFDWWSRDLVTAGNLADQSRLPGGQRWNDGARDSSRVGSYLPNPFGLYDTIGNVVEWCEDAYHESYDGAPGDGSAWVTPGSPPRVFRGGSYATLSHAARSAKRGAAPASAGASTIGVRPAMSLPVR